MASKDQNDHGSEFTHEESSVPTPQTSSCSPDGPSLKLSLECSCAHPAQHGNRDRFNAGRPQVASAEPEKPTPIASVQHQTRHIERAWRPSLLRAGALSGLGALLIALALVFAAYAILKASDGQPTADWKYQPTVYLALFTAVSNKCMAFAAVQATVVTFWLRALMGTTLGQLHRDWAYGLHAVSAACSSLFPPTDYAVVQGNPRRSTFQSSWASLSLRYLCCNGCSKWPSL